MCGIFGYTGHRDIPETLFNGLKRLEYRGYDSSGFAMAESSGELLSIIKNTGKVSDLPINDFRNQKKKFLSGISHTRWATHGAPDHINAHPHASEDGKIAVVHNGIIENYREIRQFLKAENVNYVSETDSECIVHLINYYYKKETGLFAAIQKAISELEGAFGIAVISSDFPEQIIGARRGSPLVIGIGNHETFIASDTAPIIPYTKDVIYLEDNEMVTMTQNKYTISDFHASDKEKKIITIDHDLESIEKKGFSYFMEKEIFEQPETIYNTLRGRLLHDRAGVKLDGLRMKESKLRNVKRISMVSCGTSWHAALTGEYMIENLAGIPVDVDYASEFTHRNFIPEVDTMLFAVSQSGETADTLSAIREVKSKGQDVFGIVNTVGSTIARETNAGIYLHAGPEIGVASTKAFTSQVTIMALLSLLFARQRTVSYDRGLEIVNELENIPEKISQTLKCAGQIKDIVKHYFTKDHSLFLGRGYNYPVALEGALKLKEISYIHAEGYPAAEMKHGPIALIDEGLPVLFLATNSPVYKKIISNIQEVKARKGKVIAVATDDNEEIHKYADEIIRVPHVLDMLSPLVNIIPLQLLSMYAAIERGHNVDQPRNLAKSVTVE